MDIKEFIESGVLEAYVLGTATDAERQQVDAMAQAHESVRSELSAIEELFNRMGQAQAIAPPAKMQEQIWAAIEADTKTNSAPVVNTPVISMNKGTSDNKNNIYRMAAVFVGVLCMASLAVNLYLNSKVQSMNNDLAALTQKQDSLSKQIAHRASTNDSMAQQLAMATNPNMKMVHLNGLPIAPKSHVMLYWDAQTKDVFVHVDQLPKPAEGKQYQLWAIVDGKPVDAGMITAGGMIKMKNIDGKVQAFAITLEKAGGNPTPTMDQMYVLGKV